MAYTTINKSTDYFNTKLYTGNGSTNAITGVGFQPDWTWIKQRNGTEHHCLFNSIRGATKEMSSNRSNAESTVATSLTGFDSDGFTLGSWTRTNNNNDTYTSWNWKAGDSNTTVSASGSGNNAYNACTHRANTTAGFSIVKYTGRNSDISNGQQTRVTHGLGVKPDYLIIKAVTNKEWIVCKGTDNDANLHLNKNHAVSGSEYIGNQNLNTSTYFNVGNDSHVNDNGVEYIAYVFSNKTGFSKFGTYTGNGQNDGSFVYTGFKPTFVMIKKTDTTEDWFMVDSQREPNNPLGAKFLTANNETAESSSDKYIDFVSNGFKLRDATGYHNDSASPYLYMAFGQSLVGTNGVTAKAR